MSITFGGLASNLDTNAIVTGLMAAQRVPLDQLTARQTLVSGAADSLTSFMSNVSALRAAAKTLADPAGFSSFTSTSSDPGVVASSSAGAQAGSYSVQVTALAHEQRTKSDPQSSSTSGLGMAGTLSLQVGAGTQYDIAITATDSLTSIAAKITTSGARATASVLYDGSQYRLLVRGLDTGAANSIALTENGTTLGLDTPANTYQGATDSSVDVDGIPVTRSTNLVVGVLPGMSLALTKLMAAAGTVTVAPDPAGLATKINAMVTTYNSVVSSAHFAAGYGSIKASNSVLAGDSTIRSTLDKLSRTLSNNVPGTTGKYTTLSSVGLHLTSDGSLQLDKDKLATALAADPQAVNRLFVTDPTVGATGAMGLLTTAIDSFTATPTSILTGRVASLRSQATKLSDDVTRLTALDDAYEVMLRNQFTQLELTISGIKSQSNALASLTGLLSTTSTTG